MADYNKQEAQRTFVNWKVRNYPLDFQKAKQAAGTKLLDAVCDAAKDAGLSVSQADGLRRIGAPSHSFKSIWLVCESGEIMMGIDSQLAQSSNESLPVEIEYDAFDKEWVGKGPDLLTTPRPGEPVPRRSAVAVVAEAVVAGLDKINKR